jgi:uncharacterized protein YdbL (DUF1318 family)
MMRQRPLRGRRRVLLSLAALGLGLALSAGAAIPPAMAQSLDALRASGAVGERHDGLLELRDKGNAAAKKTVTEVNAKRSKVYADRAASEGVEPAQVGKVYAKEILEKAPDGTWFLKPNGAWVQK